MCLKDYLGKNWIYIGFMPSNPIQQRAVPRLLELAEGLSTQALETQMLYRCSDTARPANCRTLQRD